MAESPSNKKVELSEEQNEILVDYLEKNPRLLSRKLDAECDKQDKKRHWEILTEQLNATDSEHPRTEEQWKEEFESLKRKVKRRAKKYGVAKLTLLERRFYYLMYPELKEHSPSRHSPKNNSDDSFQNLDSSSSFQGASGSDVLGGSINEQQEKGELPEVDEINTVSVENVAGSDNASGVTNSERSEDVSAETIINNGEAPRNVFGGPSRNEEVETRQDSAVAAALQRIADALTDQTTALRDIATAFRRLADAQDGLSSSDRRWFQNLSSK